MSSRRKDLDPHETILNCIEQKIEQGNATMIEHPQPRYLTQQEATEQALASLEKGWQKGVLETAREVHTQLYKFQGTEIGPAPMTTGARAVALRTEYVNLATDNFGNKMSVFEGETDMPVNVEGEELRIALGEKDMKEKYPKRVTAEVLKQRPKQVLPMGKKNQKVRQGPRSKNKSLNPTAKVNSPILTPENDDIESIFDATDK